MRLLGNGPTGFGARSTAEDVVRDLDLRGKNVLITGTNSGIGNAMARALSTRGARVLASARSTDKAEATCATLEGAVPVVCDLSEPTSIASAIDRVRALDLPLHAIVCNAGILKPPQLVLQHGYEAQFFTNHVGHFLLVTGLLEQLAPDGRVVVVSSWGHHLAPASGIDFDNLDGSRGYRPWRCYGRSKLANLLFARALARRLPDGQTANAAHPGTVTTGIVRNFHPWIQQAFHAIPLVFKRPEQGAATQTYLAVHPRAADVTGTYWEDCNPATPSRRGRDEALAEALWERTEQIAEEVRGQASASASTR